MTHSHPRALVYVVDDSPTVRLMVSQLLHEYVVVECDSGDELERALAQVAPALVVLDMALPGRDAFEILGQGVVPVEIPVVLISAEPSNLVAAAAMNDRVWGRPGLRTLAKILLEEHLAEVVRGLLGHSQP